MLKFNNKVLKVNDKWLKPEEVPHGPARLSLYVYEGNKPSVSRGRCYFAPTSNRQCVVEYDGDDWSDIFVSGKENILGVYGFRNGSYVKNVKNLFKNCSNLSTIFNYFDGLNLPNATDRSSMFEGCSSLTSIPDMDCSNCTDMSYMFKGCTNLANVGTNLRNTSKVTNMSYMFSDCTNLTNATIDINSVTDISNMFAYCNKLTDVSFNNVNTNTDINGNYCFYGCDKLTNLLTDNILNMNGCWRMFSGCKELSSSISLNLINSTQARDTFYNCKKVPLITLYNTNSITTFYETFYGCSSLTSIPLFDTHSAITMQRMFYGCSALTSIPLFNTANLNMMSSMFQGCINVQTGALALYQQASSQANPPTYHTSTFYGCGSNTQTGSAELAQIPSDWK